MPRSATSAGIDAFTMSVAEPSSDRYKSSSYWYCLPNTPPVQAAPAASARQQTTATRTARAESDILPNDILNVRVIPPLSMRVVTIQRARAQLPEMPQRLFLIDGSSQMYRAYHAMRGSGLTGPGGRSTHAVYIFVTMLRKLHSGSPAGSSSRPRSISPARPSASEMATDYKANRRADAARSRRADSRGSTKRARRWVSRSSPTNASRPTM